MERSAAIQAGIVDRGGRRIAMVNAGVAVIGDAERAQRFLDAVNALFFRGHDTVLIGLDADGKMVTFGPPSVVARIHDLDPRRVKWSRYCVPVPTKAPARGAA